jgi:hypothetical protein
MQDNRNVNTSCGSQQDARGAVCIDTKRVLDSCRDRDCFEDARVYLSADGEAIIAASNSVRIKDTKLISAYVGVDPIPFNCGFYRITVRYYVKVDGEGCLGVGRSQCFTGIAALEKDVVLYGGEGNLRTFSSGEGGTFCGMGDPALVTNDAPVAVVEAVEPIVLGQKVVDCQCGCNECGCEIPACVCECAGCNVCMSNQGTRLLVSFGVFSVIRIMRPAQILVQATDYSVPDKECVPATSDENPCALFNTIAFPVSEFKTGAAPVDNGQRGGGGCGCGR